MSDLAVHHIPVCPFSQRQKILLALKGIPDAVRFHVVDITRPAMNQDPARRDAMQTRVIEQFAALDAFLEWQNPNGDFLFDRLGLAEAVFTPILVRFWFLEALPDGRAVSSFAFAPHWSERPWPPRNKYALSASDAELGLDLSRARRVSSPCSVIGLAMVEPGRSK